MYDCGCPWPSAICQNTNCFSQGVHLMVVKCCLVARRSNSYIPKTKSPPPFCRFFPSSQAQSSGRAECSSKGPKRKGVPPHPPLKIRSFPQKVCRKFDAGNATSSVACERRLPKCYWRIARHLLQGTTHPFPSLSFRPDPERSEGVVEESAVVLRLVYIGTTSGCPHRLDQATLSRNVLLNAV